jgi:Flp pilus assembly protein TadD
MSRKHRLPRTAPQRILPLPMLYDEALRHHGAGELREAEQGYRKILSIAPDHADSLHLLGVIARQTGHAREAEALIRRSIALSGGSADSFSNLGNVLQMQNRFDEAELCYNKALALDPVHTQARNNLGGALLARGQTEAAIACFGEVLRLAPQHAGALHNLGTALYQANRLDEAVACYRQALALEPNFDKTHLDMALALLKLGDLEAGLREYEWRWRCHLPSECRRNFTAPRWQGEPLAGRRILLYGEQGLGDCLQFLRYLPQVRAAGGRIVLELPPTLLRLAAELDGIETLVPRGQPLSEFDCHCPLMSLPLVFGTTLATIPAPERYLCVPDKARQKAAALDWPPAGLRVGLAWNGSATHCNNRFRSIAAEALAPLLAVEGVHFYSLQVDGSAHQQPALRDLAPQIIDMADTAALIEQLDLVIAVDTAVAHLAAALGKPVWLLLPANADWRWLAAGERSPWYPSLRLYRQSQLGDWQPPIARVAAALAAEVR